MVDPSCANLATKAELQELRDQLNAALGSKEDGGIETIFASGKSTTAITAGIGVTLLGMAKTNAPNVITDIALQKASEAPIWKELEARTAKWITTKGNGSKLPSKALEELGKAAGQGVRVGKTSAKVAKNSANATMALANLVTIGATLALNKFTVDVLDKRIDAEAKGAKLQADANSAAMLRMYQNYQGDLDKVRQEIEESNSVAEQNKRDIDDARNHILILQNNDLLQQADIETLKSNVATLRNENIDLRVEIATLEDELIDTRVELEAALDTVEKQLEEAEKVIASQEEQLEKQREQIAAMQTRMDEYETRLDEYKTELTQVKDELGDLKTELDLIKDLNPDLITEPLSDNPTEEEFTARWTTYYETTKDTYKRLFEEHNKPADQRKRWASITSFELQSQVTEREYQQQEEARRYGFGGSSTAKYGAAAAQTGVLKLAERLGSPDTNVPTQITTEDLQNGSQEFERRLAAFLPTISNPSDMTPEQMQAIETQLRTVLNTTVIPRIDDVKERTSEPKIAAAVQTGICQSLNNPTACQVPGVDNPKQGLKGMSDGLGNKLDALQTLLDLTILKYVKSTNETVLHAKHGLEAVQKFGEKAWQATHADKILNAITTAIVIHNGIQLSQNLLVTLGETASVVLQAIGVKDSNNEDIDVNAWFQVKMRSWMESILGTENYAALTTRIAKYNRIYQAGANILDASRELFDSARSTAELTAENTGKIGNALLRSGVVSEDSYTTMIDKVYPHSKAMRRLERFRNGLEEVEDSVSTVGNIASEVVSTKDAFTELKEAKKEWKEANDALVTEKDTATNETKEESTVVDGIKNTDFDREETEE